jgi:hypothetical protein
MLSANMTQKGVIRKVLEMMRSELDAFDFKLNLKEQGFWRVDTILLSYQKGAYFFVDRQLDQDFDLQSEIGQKLNPRSLFWQFDESDF